jgi:predicted deacetylase
MSAVASRGSAAHLRLVPSPATPPARAESGARLAVAIHDVEPATYERCALMREWLADHGVDRVTLLVIPAPDLHPFADRRPELASWLRGRIAEGDAVAQHGLQHRQARRGKALRQVLARWQARDAAEFVGLDPQETRRAVESGRRLLKLAGVEPRGFVAPGYAYTPSLRAALAGRFDWWADILRLHRGGRSATLSPALTLGTATPLKRALSPLLIRTMSVTGGSLLRLDLHPADLDHSRHMLALDAVLQRAGRRTAVTYDDLVAA